MVLNELVKASTEDQIDAAFEIIFDLIHQVRESGDFSSLKEMIMWASEPSVSPHLNYEVLLSILRLSFSIRDEIKPQWTLFHAIVKQKLLEENKDVDKLLWGLTSP